MSTIKYCPNGPNTKPSYDIGTEGLEHSREGIIGFVADVFRATYSVLPIPSALATAFLDWNGKSVVPTYGLWAGPSWSGGSKATIDWNTLPCYNENIRQIETNPINQNQRRN